MWTDLEAPLAIANPIYREVIPRQLTYSTEMMTVQESAWYVRMDGTLDMVKLLTAFQEFFREHSEHWVERFQYKEAGPQLLLHAFLHRIVNGGGRIEREYGLGRLRTDLLILWFHAAGVQKTEGPLPAGEKELGTRTPKLAHFMSLGRCRPSRAARDSALLHPGSRTAAVSRLSKPGKTA